MVTENQAANESLAYIAGILDGEGCITITTRKGKQHAAIVRITNTCWNLIEYINLCFPGNVSSAKRKERKQLYNLSWFGRTSIDVLELLLPYLIVKKEAAEMVIEFYQNCILENPKTGHGIITEAEIILRNSYKETVSNINRQGD